MVLRTYFCLVDCPAHRCDCICKNIELIELSLFKAQLPILNFCSLFQARLFDEPQLASLCLENIDKNTGDALAAEGFTDIDLGNAPL